MGWNSLLWIPLMAVSEVLFPNWKQDKQDFCFQIWIRWKHEFCFCRKHFWNQNFCFRLCFWQKQNLCFQQKQDKETWVPFPCLFPNWKRDFRNTTYLLENFSNWKNSQIPGVTMHDGSMPLPLKLWRVAICWQFVGSKLDEANLATIGKVF